MSRPKPVLALLGLCLLLAPPAAAAAKPLKGYEFFSIVEDNTLSGETAGGVAYKLYFLAGGIATYAGANGVNDMGRWRIDDAGDVCLTLPVMSKDKEDCYSVSLDGSNLSWEGKGGSGTGTLFGGISPMTVENRP